MTTIDELVQLYPVCQQRTGKAKKFTLLINNEIYKGSYTSDQALNILSKYKLLLQWKTEYLIKLKCSIQLLDGYYINYENVGIPSNVTCTLHQESFSKYKYNLIEEKYKLPKVSTVLENKQGDFIYSLSTKIAISLTKLMLAGVGDRSLYNIITDLNKQTVYIIDIDDNAPNNIIRDDVLFYLSKNVMNKKYRDKWISSINGEEFYTALEKDIITDNINILNNLKIILSLIKKYYPFKMSNNRQTLISILISNYPELQRDLIYDSTKWIESAFIWYDQNFFKNTLYTGAIGKGYKFSIEWNNRLLTSAGRFYVKAKNMIIEFSNKVFQNMQSMICNGITCGSKLETFLVTLEHEMLHMHFKLYSDEPERHGANFKKLAYDLFGHTETTHSLFSDVDTTKTMKDFKVNDEVFYIDYDPRKNISTTVKGKIIKLGPVNAKVKVDDKVYLIKYRVLRNISELDKIPTKNKSTNLNNPQILPTEEIKSTNLINKQLSPNLATSFASQFTNQEILPTVEIKSTNLISQQPNYNQQPSVFIDYKIQDLPQLYTVNTFDLGLGQMTVKKQMMRGYGGTTYHGFAIDVMKSGLQKYIRRGLPEKAILCATELWHMQEIENGYKVVDNMYQRLEVIAFEDIGVANIDLVFTITNIINDKVSLNLAQLCTIVQMMSESLHSRLLSWIWTTYVRSLENPYLANSASIKIEFYNQNNLKSNLVDFTTQTGIYKYIDNNDIIVCSSELYYRLIRRDINAFTWLGHFLNIIFNQNPKLLSRIRNRQITDILLWQIIRLAYSHNLYKTELKNLFNLPTNTSDALIMNLCEKQYFKHTTDKRIFILMAVWITLTTPSINIKSLDTNFQIWSQSSYLNNLKNKQYNLIIDDYIVDKHTQQGRSQGMTVVEFKQEGSQVANEDQNILKQYGLLKEIYNNFV